MGLYLLVVFVLASIFCLSESLMITEPNVQNVLEVVKVSNHHHHFTLILI